MRTAVFLLATVLLVMFPVSRFSAVQIYNEDYSRPQKMNLYKDNKVWMVYGWTFLYPKGVQEKKGRKTSFERFDRDGNLSEEILYDDKGKPAFSCQYLYDEAGRELKKVGGSADDLIYEKWKYSVLESGKKVERRSEYKQGKEQKWIYTYDALQNIIEEQYFDYAGVPVQRFEYTYDGKQNVTEKREYDSYGNVYQRWSYTYDDKGNNTEARYYVSNNQLYRIYQMRYDRKGNMKSKFEFDKDEKVQQLTVFVYQFYDGLHAPRTTGNKN